MSLRSIALLPNPESTMPVKLGSKLPTESAEARIEIVPLIDIMFFLLASFMLVSLSMVNIKSVKVNLPTATTATPDYPKGLRRHLGGQGRRRLPRQEAGGRQRARRPPARGPEGQPQPPRLHQRRPRRPPRHVIHVLDLVRSAGIDKVAFEIRDTEVGKAGNP